MDKNIKEKKVYHKVLRFFLLALCLKCLYGCSYTITEMRWYYNERPNKKGVVLQLIDAKVWKDFDTKFP